MLPQEKAVQQICESLKQDARVQAIFLKGSMGREEHDEHSDIDLYCLVEKDGQASFLSDRLTHLQAYRDVIFTDDIFIVAPQLIAVYDDFLHIDLFTVTIDAFAGKDYFKVLYDPENLLTGFKETQGLELTAEEYRDHVNDTAWFLFQYKKAAARGNAIWAAKMLLNSTEHLAKVLLSRYAPERAQLGLKTLQSSLPESLYKQMITIFNKLTPANHPEAAGLINSLVSQEIDWMMGQLEDDKQIEGLMKEMIRLYSDGTGQLTKRSET